MAIENLITTQPRTPLIAASILSADFARMGAEARAALEAGADLLHLDVMDGHFVGNLTMGPDMCRGLSRSLPGALLDVHLMVRTPAAYVEPFAAAGAGHLTFHIEAAPEPASLAGKIRAAGMTAGLAINPSTDVTRIMPFVQHVDLVLVMSVEPGFAGQEFMVSVLETVGRIKPVLGVGQRLQIDGGINAETAQAARDAGCDCLVAASAIFGAAEYAPAIAALRGGHVPQGDVEWP